VTGSSKRVKNGSVWKEKREMSQRRETWEMIFTRKTIVSSLLYNLKDSTYKCARLEIQDLDLLSFFLSLIKCRFSSW